MNQNGHPINTVDDETLVLTSLGGDREAFCEIVKRYQNLLCSIAYASVGDLKQSEDIAQEVFVEAWQKLDTLRDPQKLKFWLCGILRFKVSHYLRKESTQPFKRAEELDEQHAIDVLDNHLEQGAISEQQLTLLWQTLSSIDITYREPMVLFYREQKSVEHVADELDLSVDTAKQRLSRGRKLLKQTMEAFLEQALEKTKPSTAFAAGVLAALEESTKQAAAATLGAGTVKGTSLFNFAAIVTVLASVSGLISSFFGLKASLYQSRTENEKKLAIKTVSVFLSVALLYVLSTLGLKIAAEHYQSAAQWLAISAQVLMIVFVLGYLTLTSRMFSQLKALRANERIFHPDAFTRDVDQSTSAREYKSRLCIFGIPLIHFQLGAPEQDDKPCIGWIAGGAKAYGLLFAWGGVAIAPISVGIVSWGVVTVGAVGFGLFSTGAVAVGLFAFGASAIGYKAYASLTALGWESAFSNGFAIAYEAAIAPFAYAAQVNNELAYQLADFSLFGSTYQWALAAVTILVIVPSYIHYKLVQKRMK